MQIRRTSISMNKYFFKCYCNVCLPTTSKFVQTPINNKRLFIFIDAILEGLINSNEDQRKQQQIFNIFKFVIKDTLIYLHTFSDFKPAVGVMSEGSDSGIGSVGSSRWIPGQPTQSPPPLMTTGATAVTRPPAL